jgi:two-component system sensor histidine kinase/response regulator
LDGLQATRHIKEDPELGARPKVVLVTAFGLDEVREEAERLHIDGFLLKPVTMSMLVDTLVSLFAADAEDRAVPTRLEDLDAGGLDGLRILLVEDNEINQQIATELLVSAGAKVGVANNGVEALAELENQRSKFDLVLMDLQMPLLDGYETTKEIRSDARLAGLPIVAITAHATVEERQKCLDAGMNGHVSKPIDPAVLFAAIRLAVGSVSDTGHALPQAVVSDAKEIGQPVLSEVPGLNSADGMQRVAGNEKLYRKLLRQFAATERDAAERIAAALAVHDRVLAEQLAHAVKGVAGNIGALRVQNAAANLEKAIGRSAAAADIESWLATLDECLG